jgi:predicted RNase H-like nuclease (RuvC/YqgF family)
MNFFVDNWLAILGFLSAPLAWIFGGKQAKKVEIKNSTGDFLNKVQTIYDGLVDDLKADREELKACNLEQDKQIKDLSNDVRSLQKQFNDLYLSYAKEVEASTFWKEKFNELESKYVQLEKDHEELKKQFENYKKAHK